MKMQICGMNKTSQYEKYFVIGYNKTGTTTFHTLFLINGLRTQHGNRNDKSKKWDVDSYDCFSDNGQMNDFEKLDEKFPNAIFILNTRNLRSWLISRLMHGQRIKSSWAYPPSVVLCHKWILERDKYHRKVLEHFKNKKEKLIIVSIDEKNWITYLANKLNFKHYDESIMANKAQENESMRDLMASIVDEAFAQWKYSDNDKKQILIINSLAADDYLKIYQNNISTIKNPPQDLNL